MEHSTAPELNALDREWTGKRTLQTNFAVFSLLGLALGTGVNRKWLRLAVAVPAFRVQHAIQGWCQPLAVLRRVGFCTSKEINEERFALKALRGDFQEASLLQDADQRLNAAREQIRINVSKASHGLLLAECPCAS